MNCPYCNEPADQLDSIVKLPNGDRVHFKCSDKMLAEWVGLKTENRRLFVVLMAAVNACDELEGQGLHAINKLRAALAAAGYGGEE